MKLSYLFLAVIIICSACSKKTRKAPNGFEFQVVREGEGEFGSPDHFLVMNMVYKDDKDSVWFDTQKLERPGVIMIQDTSTLKTEKGMESVFRVMKKGDSIIFKVLTKSLFEDTWKTEVPPGVKPEGYLTFFIGVRDVVDREGVNKLQTELQAKDYEKSLKLRGAQLALDTLAIDAYLLSNKINAVKMKEGVRYVITKHGSGDFPVLSSTVKANYKGSLLTDGSVFQEGPLEYPLSRLIQGWQIGFQQLQKGCKATLYIPSSLGYGPNGSPPQIPANANLVFEIELIDFMTPAEVAAPLDSLNN